MISGTIAQCPGTSFVIRGLVPRSWWGGTVGLRLLLAFGTLCGLMGSWSRAEESAAAQPSLPLGSLNPPSPNLPSIPPPVIFATPPSPEELPPLPKAVQVPPEAAKAWEASSNRPRFRLPRIQALLKDSIATEDKDGDGDIDNDDNDDEDEGESIYFPDARRDPSKVDIRTPGPDIANFPNGAYTLRQGRFFIESSPLFLSGASAGSAKTYNAEVLLRYGLTDRVELRLFSNGPTAERGNFAASGMAPLAWDIKVNLWRENRKRHIPAVGLEVFLLTASGSKKLNQGTQPSVNLLFDHTLPYGFLLEWNIGIVGDPSPNNRFSSIEPAVSWALQREIFEDFDIFFQGYLNGPTLPRYADGVELGFGAVWALNRRLAIYGSYNEGVSKAAPNVLAQLGAALAF